MNNLLPLMQREWLQHRFAWALLVLVPLGLALLLLGVGQIELDDDMKALRASELAVVVSALTMLISAAVLCMLLGVTSLFIALGSPRRDDGDRSTEFWLSLPSGHAESLLAPMLVHLLLVPMAALAVGLLAAIPVSLVTVGRVAGVGEWLALPWGTLLAGVGAMILRAMAGVPLALLWLLPLLMAAMLCNAYFRRWGLPLLAVVLLLLSLLLERVFGQPIVADTLAALLSHAATSVAGASGGAAFTPEQGATPSASLGAVPGWALRDFGAALRDLAQPLLAGALVVSAGLFAALWAWRGRMGGRA